jgi:hypothetical protein
MALNGRKDVCDICRIQDKRRFNEPTCRKDQERRVETVENAFYRKQSFTTQKIKEHDQQYATLVGYCIRTAKLERI